MVAALFLLFNDFSKTRSLLISSILDFGHIPLFMMITAMVLWVLDWRRWPVTSLKNYILAGIIAFGLSLITEILQQYVPGRSFEIRDIASNLVGSSVFLLMFYQYKRHMQLDRRLTIICIACLLLLCAGVPVLTSLMEELRARGDFPLLASFETRWEMKRWMFDGSVDRSTLHATHGKRSLQVNLAPGLYPGASLINAHLSWKGYDALLFDAFLKGNTPLALTVRINDLAHTEAYEDRYNRTFILVPGENLLTIDLSEVEHAPKGRLMAMEHIGLLRIFSYELKEQRTVYFDNFRLEKDG
jgi:hypothetical protein